MIAELENEFELLLFQYPLISIHFMWHLAVNSFK